MEDNMLAQFTTEEINKQIDLKNLVSVTSQQFIKDREEIVGGLVRGLFMKKKALFEDVIKLEKELNKKRESLKQVDEKIEKVRQGDWEVLKKLEEENKKGNQQQSNQEEKS